MSSPYASPYAPTAPKGPEKKEAPNAYDALVLVLAVNGGKAPGMKNYELFAKLDEKGHSAASYKHYFTPLAAKAKGLLDKHPEVALEIKNVTPKKRAGAKKRKLGEGMDTKDEDAGEGLVNEQKVKKRVKAPQTATVEDAEEE